MFCGRCGNRLDERLKLCPTCDYHEINHIMEQRRVAYEQRRVASGQVGHQNDQGKKEKPKSKKLVIVTVIITLVCCLLLGAVGYLILGNSEGERFGFLSGERSQESGQVERGFDTPEEAIIAYLEGLRDSNMDKMLSAFAIEVYIENFDFESQVDRLGAHMLHMDVGLPNANEFATSVNVERRRGKIVEQIYLHNFVFADIYLDGRPEIVEDASTFTREFEADLNRPNFQTLEVLGFIPPEAFNEIYLDERNQENLARWARVLGVDELANLAVVFQLDGQRSILFAELGSYNGQWFMLHLAGNLSHIMGISSLHAGVIPPGATDYFLREYPEVWDAFIPIDEL